MSEISKPALYANLSEVPPAPVTWLRRPYIPDGALTLIVGDPAVGKSTLTCDLIARISTGTPWPNWREPAGEPAGVLIISGDDDLARTIRPRLDAAGADVGNVRAITGVAITDDEAGESIRAFNLDDDLDILAAQIADVPNCRAVIIDPLACMMGRFVNDNRNADVRAVLGPMADLAGRTGVAIIAVTHMNKGGGANAMYRGLGSIAYVAASRAAYLVCEDQADTKRRLLLCIKSNLGPKPDGLSFTLETTGDHPTVLWGNEPVTITADEALQAPEKRTERDEAKDFLRDVLKANDLDSKEVLRMAASAGIAERTLWRAKRDLKVDDVQEGYGKHKRSLWRLPSNLCQPISDTHTVAGIE